MHWLLPGAVSVTYRVTDVVHVHLWLIITPGLRSTMARWALEEIDPQW